MSNIATKAGFKTPAEYVAKSKTSESNLAFSNMFNKLLTEDPDNLWDLKPRIPLSYKSANAVTFAIIGDMYFQLERFKYMGMPSITHGDLLDELKYACRLDEKENPANLYKKFINKTNERGIQHFNVTQEKLLAIRTNLYKMRKSERTIFEVSGRLWVNNVNIIAFWQRKSEISKSDLELLKKGILHFNTSIPDISLLKVNPMENEEILIPFDEYFNNNIISKYSDAEIRELQLKQHLNPNAKKQLIGTSSGIGSSKLSNIATKAGFKTPAEYVAKSKTSESLFSDIFKLVL